MMVTVPSVSVSAGPDVQACTGSEVTIGEPAPHVLVVSRKLESIYRLSLALKKSGLTVTGWEVSAKEAPSLFNVDCSHILVDEEALIDYDNEYSVAKAIREFDVPVAVLSDTVNLSVEVASLDLNISLVLSKNLHPDAMALKLIDFINQDKSNLSGNSHEVNDQTNQFLAHIGHEIRTPLNGILGTAELLSNLNLPPLQASYVNTIKSSGNTLLLVLNDLLGHPLAVVLDLEDAVFTITEGPNLDDV
jgi:signal transduction histidine kinase